MISIGPMEGIFLTLICLLSLVVPGFLLVFGFLIYSKLNRIEEMLKDKYPNHGN